MANTTIPFKIATTNNSSSSGSVSRAVTNREANLISQIGELKEKLLLSEIAMDEKDVQIAKEQKRNKQQRAYISQFDRKLDDLKLQNLETTDKFYKLKTVANRASDIAREKHENLKRIEAELDKQQQALFVSQRIQAQLMDLIVKQSVEKNPVGANSEDTQLDSIEFKGSVFLMAFKNLPKTVSQFLKQDTEQNKNSRTSAIATLNSMVSDVISFISEKAQTKFPKKSKTSSSKENNQVVDQPLEAAALPKIKWCATSKSLPSRSGLYYVTDGKNVEISLFNAESKRFNRTDSYMPIDFWCVKPKKLD